MKAIVVMSRAEEYLRVFSFAHLCGWILYGAFVNVVIEVSWSGNQYWQKKIICLRIELLENVFQGSFPNPTVQECDAIGLHSITLAGYKTKEPLWKILK